MALISCPECTNTISEYARACPHCGFPAAPPHAEPVRDVTVTGVEMPFFGMVGFMVKWAIASIPAGLIIAALLGIGLILGAALTGGALAGLFRQ